MRSYIKLPVLALAASIFPHALSAPTRVNSDTGVRARAGEPKPTLRIDTLKAAGPPPQPVSVFSPAAPLGVDAAKSPQYKPGTVQPPASGYQSATSPSPLTGSLSQYAVHPFPFSSRPPGGSRDLDKREGLSPLEKFVLRAVSQDVSHTQEKIAADTLGKRDVTDVAPEDKIVA